MHLSLKSLALIQSSRLSVTAACVDSLLTEGSLAVAAAMQHRSSSIATATIQHTQVWWETSSSPRSSGKPAANCAQSWYVSRDDNVLCVWAPSVHEPPGVAMCCVLTQSWASARLSIVTVAWPAINFFSCMPTKKTLRRGLRIRLHAQLS
jgi:hypothetical protein